MLTNFLKVTLRTLYREKVYAIINIAGLSIAIACCIILGLYIRSELTYDRHNIKHDQIYRIIKQYPYDDRQVEIPMVSKTMGPVLKKEFPEVKDFVRFVRAGQSHLFKHEDNAIYWPDTYYADNSVFDIFTHKIIYGNHASALTDKRSIAVSESFAKKYFGDKNPLGQLISDDAGTYKIKLVFADLPENTQLKYDVLLSLKGRESNEVFGRQMDVVMGFGFNTYLLMQEGYNSNDFEEISNSLIEKYMDEGMKKAFPMKFWIQPLTDIHFDKKVPSMGSPTVNYYYLYGFLAVGVFIFLVACINYINLAIARAAKRAKEVGMRKILGSGKKSLVLQFTGESVFFSLVALFLGLALAEAFLHLTNLNELIGKSLSLDFFNEPQLFVWMLFLSLVFGLISGIYPALYLSSIRPVSALAAGYKGGKYSAGLREILVLVQLVISVCIIACTLIMFLQMHYISNKSLGFKKENRLIITLRGADLIDKIPTIKNEILKNGNIFGASYCSNVIGRSAINFGYGGMGKTIASYKMMEVDKDFIKVMGVEIISGSDFRSDTSTDFIVNETMANKVGWDEPIGQSYFPEANPGKVIGVVKDFHIGPLYRSVDSFMFKLYRRKGPDNIYHGSDESPAEQRRNKTAYLALNIAGENIPQTIRFLENKFEEFNPEHPFEFEFLDDVLNQMYISEQSVMKLIGIFASVCIFISCLGLFGLTAFSTEQRTKEIGTRKVLGATTWQIIAMFSKRILLLVLGGAIFASFGAYYAMDEWLTRFAYKIDIEVWVFFISAAAVALLAFIAIAFQAFRAAQANPVEALRYE